MVTPPAGVRIETILSIFIAAFARVTPPAGVRIETLQQGRQHLNIESLPPRECGLKLPGTETLTAAPTSLPPRECGLKQFIYKK